MPAKIKNRGSSKHKSAPKPRGVTQHEFNKVYWPYIPLALLIAGLMALGFKSGALTRGLKHPSGEVLAYSTSMETGQLLNDSNQAREKSNEPVLELNSSLTAAAQAKANDMASRNYWSHQTPDGSQPWVFVIAKGYQYQKAGENLAAGFDNEQSVVNAWLASAPHRHNLLDPAYRDVGFGVANVVDYKAAGGGAMTVVVAFYGDPVGSFDQQVITSQNRTDSSFNSASALSGGQDFSKTSTRADVSLASYHVYGAATLAIALLIAGALIIWGSRHVLAFRRVIVKGESFVFNHPLIDVGLLLVAALAFLLNQTAGFIN